MEKKNKKNIDLKYIFYRYLIYIEGVNYIKRK